MASKMYILIKDNLSIGQAVLAAAHASLSGYLTFTQPLDPTKWSQDHIAAMGILTLETETWAKESFRKVVCKVTDAEFEKAKTYDIPKRVMIESSLGTEVAIVFAPREEWPKFFNFLKLYK